jgi:hypothetical protein
MALAAPDDENIFPLIAKFAEETQLRARERFVRSASLLAFRRLAWFLQRTQGNADKPTESNGQAKERNHDSTICRHAQE